MNIFRNLCMQWQSLGEKNVHLPKDEIFLEIYAVAKFGRKKCPSTQRFLEIYAVEKLGGKMQ
jgi:hypothetical protein